jgi:hypothetical protein
VAFPCALEARWGDGVSQRPNFSCIAPTISAHCSTCHCGLSNESGVTQEHKRPGYHGNIQKVPEGRQERQHERGAERKGTSATIASASKRTVCSLAAHASANSIDGSSCSYCSCHSATSSWVLSPEHGDSMAIGIFRARATRMRVRTGVSGTSRRAACAVTKFR